MNGQADGDGGTTARRVVNAYLAAHGVDEPLGHRETETDAVNVGRTVPMSLEGFEYGVTLARWDSTALVDNSEDCGIADG